MNTPAYTDAGRPAPHVHTHVPQTGAEPLCSLLVPHVELTLAVAPCPASARDALAVVSAAIQTPGFMSTCSSSGNQFRLTAPHCGRNWHLIVVTRTPILPSLVYGVAADRSPLAVARAAVRRQCCAAWPGLARPARKLLTLPRHGS